MGGKCIGKVVKGLQVARHLSKPRVTLSTIAATMTVRAFKPEFTTTAREPTESAFCHRQLAVVLLLLVIMLFIDN